LPTMMTTPFAQTARHEIFEVWPVSFTAERKQPLSMSWVVVTDEDGNRRLRMSWTAAEPQPGEEDNVGSKMAPAQKPSLRFKS